MQTRPEISAENLTHLTAIFNADLVELGKWLDIELNCENFKEVTTAQAHSWTTQNAPA